MLKFDLKQQVFVYSEARCELGDCSNELPFTFVEQNKTKSLSRLRLMLVTKMKDNSKSQSLHSTD